MKNDLLLCRGNSPDFGYSRWKLRHHHSSRSTKKDGFQFLPEIIEVLIPQDFAFFINDPVSVVGTKSGAQAAIINEFHHGVKLIQAVFKGSSGKDQRESLSIETYRLYLSWFIEKQKTTGLFILNET